MPVSPLPFSRSPQDDGAFVRRRTGPVGAERTGSTERTAGPGEAGAPLGADDTPLGAGGVPLGPDGAGPALLAEEGRGPVGLLHEAREQAARIGRQLEQVQAASTGLAEAQALVARLGDMAVIGLDRDLAPRERAILQRRADQVLQTIDDLAAATLVDDRLPRGRFVPDAAGDGPPPEPFSAIGTAALGLDGLALRSPDQALAASSALDLANARLQHQARLLAGATDRLNDALIGLTSPTTTATGEPALGSPSTLLGASMLLRNRLIGNPDASIQAQAGLDPTRVGRLLDSSAG